ncbi:MAG: hypothetical protein WBL41_06195, partial [Terracidiphilus sp.]
HQTYRCIALSDEKGQLRTLKRQHIKTFDAQNRPASDGRAKSDELFGCNYTQANRAALATVVGGLA